MLVTNVAHSVARWTLRIVVLRRSRLNMSRTTLLTGHGLFDPVDELGDPGIDAGAVCLSATHSLAPTGETVQHPLTVFFAHQRASRVALKEI